MPPPVSHARDAAACQAVFITATSMMRRRIGEGAVTAEIASKPLLMAAYRFHKSNFIDFERSSGALRWYANLFILLPTMPNVTSFDEMETTTMEN